MEAKYVSMKCSSSSLLGISWICWCVPDENCQWPGQWLILGCGVVDSIIGEVGGGGWKGIEQVALRTVPSFVSAYTFCTSHKASMFTSSRARVGI